VLQLRDIAAVLATADPKDKAEVYRELSVQGHYDPHRHIISVAASPCTTERAGGGHAPEVHALSSWKIPGHSFARPAG
jgi:hypothetical protein